MKTTLLAAAALILLSATVHAQSESKVSTSAKPKRFVEGSTVEGIRIGLVRPMLSAKVKLSSEVGSATLKEKLDSTWGVSAGYARIPIHALGFTTGLTYMEITEEGSATGLVRADGNLAVGLNEIAHLKGGANLTRLTGRDASSVNPGLGIQFGAGFRVTQNIGVDAGYTMMRQSARREGANIQFQESGLELGVNATF